MSPNSLELHLYRLGVSYCFGTYDRSDPWDVIVPYYWKYNNLEASEPKDHSDHYLFGFFVSECNRVIKELEMDYNASFPKHTAQRIANNIIEGYLSAANT